MRLTALWWWIDRWRKSTAFMDMTLEEQGAYRNLIDEAHLRGGPLPNDERILAKACGDARKWKKVRASVMARFTLTAEGWRNETLDAVLKESQRRADKQRNYRNGRGNGAGNTGGSPDPSPSPVEVGKEHQPPRASVDSARRPHPLDERPVLSLEAIDAGDRFLAAYPVKQGQKAAKRAWIALNPDENTIAAIFANLEARAALGWAKNARFLPYPGRFLEDEMWKETYIPREDVAAPAPTAARVVPDADSTTDYLTSLRAARG